MLGTTLAWPNDSCVGIARQTLIPQQVGLIRLSCPALPGAQVPPRKSFQQDVATDRRTVRRLLYGGAGINPKNVSWTYLFACIRQRHESELIHNHQFETPGHLLNAHQTPLVPGFALHDRLYICGASGLFEYDSAGVLKRSCR